MKDAQLPVQEAIYGVLSEDSALTSLCGTGQFVFDQVPKGRSTPFITIGEFTVIDGSTQGIDGQELTLNVHSWDQEQSTKRLKQMMAAVLSALHDTDLELSDHDLTAVNCRFLSSVVLRDPDGKTVHGVQRFKIVVDVDQ